MLRKILSLFALKEQPKSTISMHDRSDLARPTSPLQEAVSNARSSTPTLDTDVQALLPAGVRDLILNYLGIRSLPIMPKIAQQAFQLATDPNADPEDYITVIERDESLSAKVLKIANSVYYSRGSTSRTITEAVTVVGIAELKCLMNATALSNFFPSKHPLRNQFWSHDVAVAITAHTLAQALQPQDAEMAFLGGLMHDLGKLFLLQQHSTTYEKIINAGYAEGLESVAAEILEYPFDHTHVGHIIAERWHFSPDLVSIISEHHNNWSKIRHGSVLALVKAANIIAHALAIGAGREATQARHIYEPLLPQALEFIGVGQGQQRELLSEAIKIFEDEHNLFDSWSAG